MIRQTTSFHLHDEDATWGIREISGTPTVSLACEGTATPVLLVFFHDRSKLAALHVLLGHFLADQQRPFRSDRVPTADESWFDTYRRERVGVDQHPNDEPLFTPQEPNF